MKKSDPLTQHHERMRETHAVFRKKILYHNQKAFLELKDIYWLVHEFFTTFLQREHNFTEEELSKEVKEFKHEFFSMPQDTINRWREFLGLLSLSQYSGKELDQPALHAILDEFSKLVDETLSRAYTPPDAVTKKIQQAHIFLKNDNVANAEEIYRSLVKEFDSLTEQQRQDHHEPLQLLYKAIVDARSA